MNLLVYEVLEKVTKNRYKEERIKILKDNYTGALYDVLRGTYDDRVVWLLPLGAPPPYTPNLIQSIPSDLKKECARLAYFVKGGKGDNLHQTKRESMFIQLLESIHPRDAEVVIDMINKKPIKGLTKAMIEEAFPEMFPSK